MTSPDVTADRRAHLHYALLRLAGRVPDEVLIEARRLLAQTQLADATEALTFACLHYHVPMDGRDQDLLRTILADERAQPERVDQISTADGDIVPPYTLDVPEPDETPEGVDEAISLRAAELPEVLAVWKASRRPGSGTSWPPARLVWTAEVDTDLDGVDTTAELTLALASAGEQSPLVEVYHSGTRLPAYQDLARLRGELVWTRLDVEKPRIAKVYDFADENGQPGFHEDHPLVDADEREELVEYLSAGEPLLMTTALIDDIVDPSRTEVVPLTFRTDGHWIWVDAVAYYLEQHGLAPEPDLLEHLRARAGQRPAPNGVQLARALEALDTDGDDDDDDDEDAAFVDEDSAYVDDPDDADADALVVPAEAEDQPGVGRHAGDEVDDLGVQDLEIPNDDGVEDRNVVGDELSGFGNTEDILGGRVTPTDTPAPDASTSRDDAPDGSGENAPEPDRRDDGPAGL